MTQQTSVLTTDLTIELRESEIPVPKPHEVLIEVKSVGICGSDVHYFEHGRIGPFVVQHPLILGHEASGRIVAVGKDVHDREPGMRVALEPGVPCGHCEQCRTGKYNLCPDVQFFATPPVDGAFTQYLVLDSAFAHPVPDHVSYDAAALVEPLSVGLWACQKAQVRVGSNVLITGAGPIGIITGLVARANGAQQITISDINEDRLRRAEQLGFTTVNPSQAAITDANPPDVFIECSGAAQAIQDGINALKPAGTAVLVGMSANGTVEIPIHVIQGKELWLTGTFRYAHTYPSAIALVSSGAVDLDALVSKVFTLEEVEQALTFTKHHPDAMKVIVRVSDDVNLTPGE
jgi:L-iditol 2-dehydrogenase